MEVNKILLQMRAAKIYDESKLEKTLKFAKLVPDFTTVWNYRREILTHLFEKKEGEKYVTLPAQLKVIQTEMMMLLAALKESPKSYTLWFHRQWAIEKGLLMEREVLKSMAKPAEEKQEEFAMPGQTLKDEQWRSMILEGEIKLCNKMLSLDERNFHCWNYRLWVVDTYLTEIAQRVEASQTRELQKKLLKEEEDMASQVIERNFSNYSAWHFRGIILPKIYATEPGLKYVMPLDVIKADLAKLKHAYFTDP